MDTSKQEYYRINLKLPLECKEYLQEMTWRTRSKSITEYLTALIEKDMEQHPDWRETVANKLRTITRETVANKLRTLARDCSMTGTPDILTATLALYEAFDCDNMSICQAFQTIADYVDNDGDYINRDQDGEWC